MNVNYRSSIGLVLFQLLVRIAFAQDIPTIDTVYDPQIKTVLLYPLVGSDLTDPALALNPPVVTQTDQPSLVLEFDDLTANYRPLRVKLIHCNADWKRSALNDIEFTYEYNDYPITDYQISQNTKVPYYHYRFPVPMMKLPGNYVLLVYHERNPNQVLVSRRFMIYTARVGITPTIQFSGGIQERFTDQQINFDITYKGYPLISPQDDLIVVLRQNYRDNQIIMGLKPTNIRPFDNVLEYRLFDLKNTFPGGSEYRFFDLRTVLSRGNYIDHVDRQVERNVAYVSIDGPRGQGVYVQTDDFNGLYVIDQLETKVGATQADYITTVFTLKINELPNATVFVNGAFNFWQLNEVNQMRYVPELGAYRADIPLKQGVYNYNYSVTGLTQAITRSGMKLVGNELLLEGNYSETENDYEILVYHRPPAARADQLVGYRRIGYNKRK